MQDTSHQFLAIARPALESGDAGALAKAALAHWTPRQLCMLLQHKDLDVRRVAAVTLGLVGDRSCVGWLTRALRDEDEQVNEMAEHGLWSIWFRGSKPEAVRPFREGMALLASESYELAIEKFHEAIGVDPSFAEAYNQCSIARFFMGEWRNSIEDCGRALLHMPAHFGALAGMGHCHAQLGELHEALDCYQRALKINPHMPAIARTVQRLEEKLDVVAVQDPIFDEAVQQRAPQV